MLSAGDLDFSYGDGGHSIVATQANGEMASDATVDSQGRTIVVGRTLGMGPQNHTQMVVSRLNADGSLDTTFSGDGHLLLDFGSGGTTFDVPYAVAV